jgi:ubiquinone/menaquinone biosynthesis C-methylase UbiE
MPTQRGTSGGQDQTALFEANEANAWFRRNRASLERGGAGFEVDLIENVLGAFRAEIRSVLEIGCGDGRKLERLAGFFQAQGFGIEPSTDAVAAGSKRLHDAGNTAVTLAVGTADELPFSAGQFDLVHFGFSLYVVSRERIFLSLAQADRVLRAGGFMTILDFDPHAMHRRAYVHQQGIFSYKARYDEWFAATGHYHLVAKRSFSHASPDFSKDENERLALTVLYKEPQPYPVHD